MKKYFFISLKSLLLSFCLLLSAQLQAQKLSLSLSGTSACNKNGTITAKASGGLAPYKYNWVYYADYGPNLNGTTPTLSGLNPGKLRIYVTDANDSIFLDSIIVKSSMGEVAGYVVSAHCDNKDGYIQASQFYTSYAWDTGSTDSTLSNLGAGIHTVTVTNANGCRNVRSWEVKSVSSFSLQDSLHNVGCGGNDGSIKIFPNPSGNYFYQWSNGAQTQEINQLSKGQYDVTVSDGKGCNVSKSFTIIENLPGSGYASSSPAGCSNNDGVVYVHMYNPGNYSYKWSTNPVQTSSSVSGLAAGSYTVSVSILGGCVQEFTTTVSKTDSIGLNLSIFSKPASCNGSDGSAYVKSGVAGNYTYLWSTVPPQQTEAASGLAEGYYTVTVSNGSCSDYAGVYITNAIDSLDFSISSTPEHCAAKDGSASIKDNSGLNNTYSWNTSPVQTSTMATGLSAGSYTVIITTPGGCAKTEYVYVESKSSLNINITYTDPTCVSSNGTATANVSGGVAPYTYAWDDSTKLQTTATATGLKAGYHHVKVIDYTGCSNEAYVYLSPANSFDVQESSVAESCAKNNGSATVLVSGGQPDYSYSWNTSPVQTTATATGLSYGSYEVVISDKGGCSANKEVFVEETSGLVLDYTIKDPDCGQSNGSIQVTVSGGTAPYNYYWSTGAKGSSISALGNGYYNVKVFDNGGCNTYGGAYLNESTSCDATLEGIVYHDANGNCSQDSGENGMNYACIYVDNSLRYVTGPSGYYYLTLSPGMHEIRIYNHPYFHLVCPTSYSFTSSFNAGDKVTQNYAFQADKEVHDLYVDLYQSASRPGFNTYTSVRWRNESTLPESVTVVVKLDPNLIYENNDANGIYDPVNHTVTFTNPELESFQSDNAHIDSKLIQSTPLGTLICSSAEITPVAQDINPSDNAYTYCEKVTGSYDPNRMLVSPTGFTAAGYITNNDSLLTYTIDFQNTGTDTAFTVMVRDTLDQNLDAASLKQIASSHNCTVQMDPGNVAVFTFKNILLPDSTRNEKGSHGSVQYTVKLKPSLQPGTEIKAQSSIYFDFNSPVKTTSTLNTIQKAAGIHELSAGSFTVYPNPAIDQVMISLNAYTAKDHYTIKVSNITGQLMHTTTLSAPKTAIDIESFPAGAYFIELQKEGLTVGCQKVIKQ